MRRILLVTIAGLVACGDPGQDSSGSSSQGGSTAGTAGSTASAGNGGSGAGTSGTGAAGASGASGGQSNCVAKCCGGTTQESNYDSEQDCKFYAGFACEAVGGPQAISYNGAPFWSASTTCPTMRPCFVNCCNGTNHVQGAQFDVDLCKFYGSADAFCDANGGVAKVFFDGNTVWTGSDASDYVGCSGNCVASCCDGTVVVSQSENQDQCEFWTGGGCGEEGGPVKLNYGSDVVWSAQCPSLKDCELVCKNGQHQQPTQQYKENICIFVSLGGSFCNDNNSTNDSVYFDGAKVWP